MARLATVILGGVALAIVCWRCLSSHPAQIETHLSVTARSALNGSAFGWAAVQVDGRELTLTGIAPDESSRAMAAQLVLGVDGVRNVDNRLQVAAAAPGGAANSEVPVRSSAAPSDSGAGDEAPPGSVIEGPQP